MTTSFVPKHFPRTKLDSGRALSDSQQYQYDVLRSVGGKIINTKQGWFREHSPTHRERIYGLNAIAMWALVGYGLVEAVGEFTESMTFATPTAAEKIDGPRYERVGQVVKEKRS